MTIDNNINPFVKHSGSANIANLRAVVLLLIMAGLFAVLLAKLEIIGMGLLCAIFFGSIYIYILFKNPIVGFYTAIGLNFVLLGIMGFYGVQGVATR